MAKQPGMGDRLLVGGRNISNDIGSLSRIGGGPVALDVTGIDKSAPERIGGLRDGALEFTAWFNPATARAHKTLSPLPTGDVIVTYLRGTGIGSPAANLIGLQLNYDPNRGADGSLSMGVSVQADGFGLEWGEQLTAGLRQDTTATNGASYDGGSATTFGGQAYLHVVGLTGTNVVVKLQDSADNSSWADISGAAFASATGAPSAQRIAFTGTVRRYVRAVSSGTFTDTTFVVAFVRNATEVKF